MYHNIKLMGCYWPGMMTDCINIARSCHDCQIHGDFKHQPPVPLHPTIPSWPFDAWGIDVIGMIDPPSSGGQCFILAATDYFSRRAEAIPLREVKFDNVINFLERHIIYRFGIHRRINSVPIMICFTPLRLIVYIACSFANLANVSQEQRKADF